MSLGNIFHIYISGIQSGADIAFLAILVHLFWPGGTTTYFDIPRGQNKTNNNNDLALRAGMVFGHVTRQHYKVSHVTQQHFKT